MKFIRNLLIVLIFAALVCGGASLFYYSNEYRYSFTHISVNEPAAYGESNKELAELFKRVMKISDEEENPAVIQMREPQFYITTHIGGKNQRTYDIYITNMMTRSAYIHDTKTNKLYKMDPSAFVAFLSREEVSEFAYIYDEPCEMTLSRSDLSFTGKAAVCDWNYITADGTYKKVKELPESGNIYGEALWSSEDFKVEVPYGATSLKARVYTEDNEIIFEGELSDGTLPSADCDGTIYYEITAIWNVNITKDFYGTAKYIFVIENDVPVSVIAESPWVYQGEFIRLFAENANDGDVFTANCPELGYEGTFFNTENGIISLLPIPCDAEPGIYTVNLSENGNSRSIEIEIREQSFEKGTSEMSENISAEDEAELENKLSPFRTYNSATNYVGGTFTAPVEGKVTMSFGLHRYSDDGTSFEIHNGQDIAADGNPAIKAAQGGNVVFSGETAVTGKTVIIDHGMNILSYYFHMKNTSVEVGQLVAQGDKIGNMGQTGITNGDHLHYTVMINGVATNPVTLYDLDPISEKIK